MVSFLAALTTRRNKMGEIVFFIFFVTAYGAMGLGQIVESEFNLWREGKWKPKVMYPKRFNLIPMRDQTQQKVVGYNVSVTPMQMHRTKQKEIFMDLAEIEPLGEVEDQDGALVCTGEGRELFNDLYFDAVKQWAVETSGLTLPSPEETATILKESKNPPPKNKRR